MNTDVRVKSELPAGDPALLNKVAWARRWSQRSVSLDYASNALRTAIDGQGRRSRTEQGLSHRTLAWHDRWLGRFDSAMDHCLKAESFLTEMKHPATRAHVYAILAVVYCVRLRMDLALSAVDRAEFLLDDLAEEDVAGILTDVLAVRAAVQRHVGEKARAGITLSRARNLATEDEIPRVEEATARWLLADGDTERALKHATTALSLAKKQENRVIQPYASEIIAACHAREGREMEAVLMFTEGFEIANDDGDRRAKSLLFLSQGRFEKNRGNLERAVKLLQDGAAIAKKANFPLIQKDFALSLAAAYEAQGKYKISVDQHKMAWRLQSTARLR